MKKHLIIGLILIIIGFNIGNLIFSTNNKILTSINRQKVVYFLEEGIYYNEKSLKTNTSNLTNKIIEKDNNKYHVYVGISKSKKIANKIKNIYKQKGYSITIKEKNNISEEFLINLEQFDLLMKATKDQDEVLTIEEVVLANYQEILTK